MKILKMEVMERNGTSSEWKEGSVEEAENHSLKYSEREREKDQTKCQTFRTYYDQIEAVESFSIITVVEIVEKGNRESISFAILYYRT